MNKIYKDKDFPKDNKIIANQIIANNGIIEIPRPNNYFTPNAIITSEQIEKSVNFSLEMVFKDVGYHRTNRSGGSLNRSDNEKFANILLGKMGEFGFFNRFKDKYSIEEPALWVGGKGTYEMCDFLINNKKISIKTIKHFSALLLLEKNDYDGGYLSNEKHDFTYLVKVNSNHFNIENDSSILYMALNNPSELRNYPETIDLHIVGGIPWTLLNKIMQSQKNYNTYFKRGMKFKIMGSKNTYGVRMDADNFYFCQNLFEFSEKFCKF